MHLVNEECLKHKMAKRDDGARLDIVALDFCMGKGSEMDSRTKLPQHFSVTVLWTKRVGKGNAI